MPTPVRGKALTALAAVYGMRRALFGFEPDALLRRRLAAHLQARSKDSEVLCWQILVSLILSWKLLAFGVLLDPGELSMTLFLLPGVGIQISLRLEILEKGAA